jgi:hypothetical protein
MGRLRTLFLQGPREITCDEGADKDGSGIFSLSSSVLRLLGNAIGQQHSQHDMHPLVLRSYN